MKAAMRSGEKLRLQTIRLILAAIKQQEVDTRKELTDQDKALNRRVTFAVTDFS